MHTEPTQVETFDTVVIGGGQTGLTIGHHLRAAERDFVILDANERIGDSWRRRWDSLLLFTPARFNALPGLPFPAKRDEYITKDQMADYLEEYARHFDLPVRLDTPVSNVARRGDGFEICAGGRVLRSSNVVVATSSHHDPRVPPFAVRARSVDRAAPLVGATDRRAQLPDGPVLIVGVGNSGADIAIDLADDARARRRRRHRRGDPVPDRTLAGPTRAGQRRVRRADARHHPAHPDRPQRSPPPAGSHRS